MLEPDQWDRVLSHARGTIYRNTKNQQQCPAQPVGGWSTSRRLQIATLATRHALPAVSNSREFAEAGGLMDYGTSLTEVYRQLGVYPRRVLKGCKPTALPIAPSTNFWLVCNLSTS